MVSKPLRVGTSTLESPRSHPWPVQCRIPYRWAMRNPIPFLHLRWVWLSCWPRNWSSSLLCRCSTSSLPMLVVARLPTQHTERRLQHFSIRPMLSVLLSQVGQHLARSASMEARLGGFPLRCSAYHLSSNCAACILSQRAHGGLYRSIGAKKHLHFLRNITQKAKRATPSPIRVQRNSERTRL